jgi:outer membrane protein assembly factor BamB
MSVQDHPQPTSQPRKTNWTRRILFSIALVLLVIFVGQIFLQQYLLQAGAFEDPEQIKKLKDVKLVDAGKPTNDWPQWRGPNRDGVSTETGLITSWPDSGPRVLWEVPLGQGFSAPVVAQGRLYTFFQEDDQECVVCWDAEKGTEEWRFRYAAHYKNQFGNGPRSTPTIDGDLLYTVGGTGIMHCLRTKPQTPGGEVVWSKNLLTEFAAPNLSWGVSFSPLVVGERVYVCPGGPGGNSVAALDKNTGDILWKALDDPASYSSPVPITVAGESQILFVTARNLAGLSPDKSEVLWQFPWVTNAEGVTIATPIVVQDYVFISSGYNRGCALVKIDKTEGAFTPRRVFENKKMRNHISTSVRYKDHLYGFNEMVLTCMEFRTGKVVWAENFHERGSVLVADGQLILLGESGLLALAEASPKGHNETARWVTGLQNPCWTVPVLANGRLYLRDPKKLMCLDFRR